ncbi:helix-turn-helix domain-containing protein [Chitinophaga polysaccharea]|uniref:helix-turn-helix domain-containing protein n=1 Tax=Chitinophaga polysaccharea TaxID=1293035 RepID=UPI00119CF075|nr:helix-turn-helix transcriptional regulator [Chitinophaga polysaccharea]
MSARQVREQGKKFNRLKAVLALRDMTAKDLAAKTGYSAQTISKWNTNREQPRLDDLFLMAEVLNVNPCELIEYTPLK